MSLTVVVNGGTPGARETSRPVARSRVVVNDENRGFGPAANQGAEQTSSPILLFLNPDTRAGGRSVLARSRAGFRGDPEAVALAPRLLDAEPGNGAAPTRTRRGSLRPAARTSSRFSCAALPTIAADARELLLSITSFRTTLAPARRYADRDPDETSSGRAGRRRGARRARGAFRRLGGFAEDFTPAWFEDVDLCARLAPLGRCVYWPSARFRHRGGVVVAAARLRAIPAALLPQRASLPPATLRPRGARGLSHAAAARNASAPRGASASPVRSAPEGGVGPRVSRACCGSRSASADSPDDRRLDRRRHARLVGGPSGLARERRGAARRRTWRRSSWTTASRDGSPIWRGGSRRRSRVLALSENVGFSAAMNAGIGGLAGATCWR